MIRNGTIFAAARAALLTLALVFLIPAGQAQAAPVKAQACTIHQPDGSAHEVLIWGDEFHRVLETPEGFTVVHDPASGRYCYATLDATGRNLVSTGVALGETVPATVAATPHLRAHEDVVRENVRLARTTILSSTDKVDGWPYPPCHGPMENICLLVDFPNRFANIPAAEMDAFLNTPGYTGYGNNGSVHDYWFEVTNGLMDLTFEVPDAYYRAVYHKAVYDNPAVPFRTRARQLVTEALDDLDAQGFDFSSIDCNGDGLIDGVTLLYAGPATDGGLWPHAAMIDLTYDGVTTLNYAICDIGTTPTLSTLVHEMGHAIGGFPDLYDYQGDSEGAGHYCLMADTITYPTDPVDISALCRRFAGWCDLVELTPDLLGQTMVADADANTVFYYAHPTLTNEYYLIENRHQSGRDSHVPDNGLAIWHVDQAGCNDYQQQTTAFHYLTTLLQADGRRDLEDDLNSGDDTDLWGAPDRTECTPVTAPATTWWDGTTSGLYITNISAPGPVMTFVFGPAPSGVEVAATPPRPLSAAPNPFNPVTEIAWDLAAAGPVELAVFDLQGRLVKTLAAGRRPSGPGRITWNGCDAAGRAVASGMYVVEMAADGRRESLKIMLAR
ncbi:MAG: M6 family metalloprotease domain-containing protein [bacterium]|nr:M6 family metalloprotease domain-containing protein [bacterium]